MPIYSYPYNHDLPGCRETIRQGGQAFTRRAFGETKVDIACRDCSEIIGQLKRTRFGGRATLLYSHKTTKLFSGFTAYISVIQSDEFSNSARRLRRSTEFTFFVSSPASIPIVSATLPETKAADIGGIRVERRYTYRTGDVVAPG